MSTDRHEHDRPTVADQRATIRATLAILDGLDVPATHAAAASAGATCPACATTAAAGFAIALAQELAGAGFVNGPLRGRLLIMLDGAERDLDAGHN
jgi:hypothetical protein